MKVVVGTANYAVCCESSRTYSPLGTCFSASALGKSWDCWKGLPLTLKLNPTVQGKFWEIPHVDNALQPCPENGKMQSSSSMTDKNNLMYKPYKSVIAVTIGL